MLDHMTGGRAVAGFARGYQRRWVDIMAQQTHGIHGALPHQHDEIDAANRAAFEENFPDHQKGLDRGDARPSTASTGRCRPATTPWTLETTAEMGQGRRERHPQLGRGRAETVAEAASADLFLPFASSENSIRWARAKGVTAILPPMLPVYENKLLRCLRRSVGQPRGDGIGLLRDVIIADTDAEAMALWENSGRFTGNAWFEPFGFRRGLQDPKTGAVPVPGRSGQGRLRACRHRRYRHAGAGGQSEAATSRLDFLLHVQRTDPAPDADQVDRALPHGNHAPFRLTGSAPA